MSHGHSRDVRLVGIDTPEVYGGTECGGPDASGAIKKKLLDLGDRVTLTRDPSQDAVDHYGRLLRYVEHSGIDIGRKQILHGHAGVYVYNDNPFNRVHPATARPSARPSAPTAVTGASAVDDFGPPTLSTGPTKSGRRGT